MKKPVSFGYKNQDNEFVIVATLNNQHGALPDVCFEFLKQKIFSILKECDDGVFTDNRFEMLERQDTPDKVDLED